jgi:signal transduction histidine kinase/DNA-binding response OmpR family regulator
MVHRVNRLSTKLVLITAFFLGLLALAVALVITESFRQTLQDASHHSAVALEQQGGEALLALTQREAALSARQLQQGIEASQVATQQMVTLAQLGSLALTEPETLVPGPGGQHVDTTPDRVTDLRTNNTVDIADPMLQRDLQQSAILDTLFPSLLGAYPDGVAIYYVSARDFTRYYPVIGLAEILPPNFNSTTGPWFALAQPSANPSRKGIWTPPYLDVAGNGLMVTASTPIYAGDEFQGIIGVDVTLNNLIEHLNSLKPTPNSYALLVDQTGNLVAGSPAALRDLFGQQSIQSHSFTQTLGLPLTNPEVATLLKNNANGISRVSLNGQQVFIAHAPLASIGWHLGVVAPIDEVTAQAGAVSSSLSSGIERTIRSMLGLLALFSLLALGAIALFSQRLTHPIESLVTGTRAIAAGDLSVKIPATSNDEFGLLATSFNQMTADLAAARQRQEEWSQILERTVAQRTADLARASVEAQAARLAAENANQAKNTFLANMSHELRTPLNSIINFIGFVVDGVFGPLTAEQHKFLSAALTSSEHLLGLINDILDLSKIDAGKLEFFPEPVPLVELLPAVLDSVAGLVGDKPLKLSLDMPPTLPTVRADPARMRQILLNLLSNAIKFSEKGSITLKAQVGVDEVVLSVSDTGIGITPEDQARIFAEFEQLDNSNTRRAGGMGLGLAISKRLVELQGGQMWVESEPGVGSTFYFSVPCMGTAVTEMPTQPAPVKAQAGPLRGHGPVVLVVDDDPDMGQIVEQHLAPHGYQVIQHETGNGVVELAQQWRPDLILLDVLMPTKDGWQVLYELKANPETAAIPVVMCSGLQEQRLAFHLGADDYTPKPIRADALLAAVGRVAPDRGTAVVIDDDPNALEIIKQHLAQQAGFRVILANGGEEGWAAIQREQPDVVILDLTMPEVDGFEVLRRIRTTPATQNLPVVVVTARELSAEERRILNERVQVLFTKDQLSAEELVARVQQQVHA